MSTENDITINSEEVATNSTDQEINNHGDNYGEIMANINDEEENECHWGDVPQSNNTSQLKSHSYTTAQRPLKRNFSESAVNNSDLSKAVIKLAKSLNDDNWKMSSNILHDEWSIFGNMIAAKI